MLNAGNCGSLKLTEEAIRGEEAVQCCTGVAHRCICSAIRNGIHLRLEHTSLDILSNLANSPNSAPLTLTVPVKSS